MDITALIISICAFAFSILTWFYNYLKTFRKLDFIIDSFTFYKVKDGFQYVFSCNFANLSILSLSILALEVEHESICFRASNNSKRIYYSTIKVKDEIIEKNEMYSTQLPINLAPLFSDHAYLDLLLHSKNPLPLSNPLNFVIYTNRGKIKKTIHLLEQDFLEKDKFLSTTSR